MTPRHLFHSVTDQIVMAIFIMEIVIKVIAEGNMPWLFFSDSWNCFDFAIVAVGLMPIGGGSAVTALRLIRLLRVLKLVCKVVVGCLVGVLSYDVAFPRCALCPSSDCS